MADFQSGADEDLVCGPEITRADLEERWKNLKHVPMPGDALIHELTEQHLAAIKRIVARAMPYLTIPTK